MCKHIKLQASLLRQEGKRVLTPDNLTDEECTKRLMTCFRTPGKNTKKYTRIETILSEHHHRILWNLKDRRGNTLLHHFIWLVFHVGSVQSAVGENTC